MLFNHKANTIKTFFFKIPCDCYLIGNKKENIFGSCYILYYTCSASRGKFFHFQDDKKVLRTKTKAFHQDDL